MATSVLVEASSCPRIARRRTLPTLALALALAVLAVARGAATAPPERPKTHVVYEGQRLASIAKRYNVTVAALCNANGIRERDVIRPGQRLVIPERTDKDGSRARSARLARARAEGKLSKKDEAAARKPKPPAWTDYRRTPRRKGYVEIVTHTGRFRGLVIDSRGRIRAPARKAIEKLIGATGSRPRAPDGLIRLIVRVSDTFGGRPLRIVSGYRTTSYFHDSRHKTSEAIDFHVLGVPNAALHDYLLTLGKVGVGYYPNSTFLHLDVRPRRTHWVDYSGPGEGPRRSSEAPGPARAAVGEPAEAAGSAAQEGSLPEAPEPAP